jgi:hypothetical protein
MDDTARARSFHLEEMCRRAERVVSRNLSAREWRQCFGPAPYRRTFGARPEGVPDARLGLVAPKILDWVPLAGRALLDAGAAILKGRRIG